MLTAEYDYATDIKVQRQEAIEEGIDIGIDKGIERTAKRLLIMGFKLEDVAKGTGLSVERIREIQEKI